MGTVLARWSSLGGYDAIDDRPTPTSSRLLRLAKPALLPLSTVMRVDTTDKVVALTYDDGPHPQHTPQILDVLQQHAATATFFVLVEAAAQHPEVINRIQRDGHEIGLHGLDHTRLTQLPAREAARRVREGKQRLEDITGSPVRYYRPTYGAQQVSQILAARSSGMDVVQWSAWARDWVEDDPAAVISRAVSASHPGAFVLLHDATEDTFDPEQPRPTFSRGQVLTGILNELTFRGYQFRSISNLLARYPAVRCVMAQRPRWHGRGNKA